MKPITSEKNQWIKTAVGLKQKKIRDELGLFVVEGMRFAAEIPKEWKIRFFLFSQSFAQKEFCGNWEKRAEAFIIPDFLFSKITDTICPQGILAVCEQKEENWEVFINNAKENGLYLLIEEMNDPGNLGTIIRTADACAVDAIFLSKGCADLYNPKVLRATMGSLFHIPIFQGVCFPSLCIKLNKKGCKLYAAHLQGENYPYPYDLKQSSAFVIGNEAHGLSDTIVKYCNSLIKIPMPGKAESLNASIAASVLLYEAVRQRIS